MNGAIKELEELFSTKAKGNTVYFNDVCYTPLPLPVQNAVKLIMDEYPDLRYRMGLYSVTVFDKGQSIKSSRKPIKSSNTPLPMYNVYLSAWQEPDTLIEQLKQVKDKLSIKTIAKYPNNEILVQIEPTADVLGIKKELENMADVVLADYAHVTIKPEYVVSSLIHSSRKIQSRVTSEGSYSIFVDGTQASNEYPKPGNPVEFERTV